MNSTPMASYITLTKEGQTELLDRVYTKASLFVATLDAPSPYKVANYKAGGPKDSGT